MIDIQKNFDLFPFNTFKIKAIASHFVVIRSIADLQELIQTPVFRNNKILILGGGSNMLLTKDFDGLVIKNEIKGMVVTDDSGADVVKVKAGAGETWHSLVMYCVDNGYGGIENLSLIPGTAGAAPMQNIGAYGVEMKDVIDQVEAVALDSGEVHTFSNEACKFGYRESIFKQEVKGKYFITSITLKLTRKDHKLHISYGAIQDVLREHNVTNPTIKDISAAVIQIRQSKLPDPLLIGNAGSFFKNPSIDAKLYESLREKHPTIPSFPGENGLIKVPAGWLIEQCGWKGKTFDNIGVHKHQALVLVNYGGGEGSKLWELAMNIQQSVREKFNITLQPEVNVI